MENSTSTPITPITPTKPPKDKKRSSNHISENDDSTKPVQSVVFQSPVVQSVDEADEGYSDKPRRFTIWNELVICASVIFYIADLCLDCWVMVWHFDENRISSGWFVIFCILIPNLYAGYKSLQWYLRAHAENQTKEPIKWVLRILFFPVSPLLRYYDAWRYGRQSREAWKMRKYKIEKQLFIEYLIESEEVAMLRLFIIFLEDAPIAVLNLKEIIALPLAELDSKVTNAGVVAAKLFCTMTLGVVHYVTCNKLAWHGAHSSLNVPPKSEETTEYGFIKRTASMKGPSTYNWEHFGRLSFSAELCVYIWQLLSICSRLVAYALFAVIYQPWIWLLIFIRWLIHTVWIYMDVKVLSLVNSIAFGGVYLFSFITTSPQRQLVNIVLYYVLTLTEDIIIAILWVYAAGTDTNSYGNGALSIIFGGAFGGMVFMCLYYALLHPRHEKTSIYVWWRKRKGGDTSIPE